MSLDTLFENFWNHYTTQNPHAKKIHTLFLEQEETIVNDHIALRTFDDPRVNIDQLAHHFMHYGYEEKGSYDFPIKKLKAKHFEHTEPNQPKIFISELILSEFSPQLQSTAKKCIDHIPKKILDTEALLYSGVSWAPLSYTLYKALLTESEYAAWLYAFGFSANHFTVSVNALTHLDSIEAVNHLLTQHGFKLNTAGGAIKGTPQDYLEQSSTMAEQVPVAFDDGTHDIPCCYYEFAKRYPLENGQLYTGFVAASADKIFESTHTQGENKQQNDT